VCKVSKQNVNGLRIYLRCYKNFNISGYADADARLTKLADCLFLSKSRAKKGINLLVSTQYQAVVLFKVGS
jgi:hypothetical protein